MSRKISAAAAQAFVSGYCMTERNNTRVEIGMNGTELRLHGNLIAWHEPNGSVRASLCGWGTITTRDRLNALCRALHQSSWFYQCDGEQYCNGYRVDEWESVELKAGLGPLTLLAIQAELEAIEAGMMDAGEHAHPPGSEHTSLSVCL